MANLAAILPRALKLRSMNKVGVVELWSHHHHVVSQCDILMSLNFDVHVFISRDIAKQLKGYIFNNKKLLTFIIQEDQESNFCFFLRCRNAIREDFDFVFINTIQGRVMWYFIFWPKTVTTIISNGRVSDWFGRSLKFLGFNNLRDFAYHNYSYVLTSFLKYKFKNMIFHTPQAQCFAKKNSFKGYSVVLPFRYARKEVAVLKQKQKLSIVVTGSISSKQRDYFGFLSSLCQLQENSLAKIELTLLSKLNKDDAYQKSIYEIALKLETKGLIVNYYETWVTDDDYDAALSQADLVLSPINVDAYYSAGELTSAMVHAIEYSIPGVYPTTYKPDEILCRSSIYYSSFEDLNSKILNLTDKRFLLDQLHANALLSSQYYNQTHSKQVLNNYLLNLCQK